MIADFRNPDGHPSYEVLADLPWAYVAGGDLYDEGTTSAPGILKFTSLDLTARVVSSDAEGAPILRIRDFDTAPEPDRPSQIVVGELSRMPLNDRKFSVITDLDSPFELGDLNRVSLSIPYAETLIDYVLARRLAIETEKLAASFSSQLESSLIHPGRIDPLMVEAALESMLRVVSVDEEHTLSVAERLRELRIEYVKVFHGLERSDIMEVESFMNGYYIGDDSIFNNPKRPLGKVNRTGLA